MKTYNVLLACQNGMSTGIMKKKIEQAAEADGVELHVRAVGLDEITKEAHKVDIVLLAPQVRYAYNSLKNSLEGVTSHMLIDSIDFGTMNGKAVYEKLIAVINGEQI